MSNSTRGHFASLPKDQAEGAVATFATTHWSVVMQTRQENSPAGAAALETLCHTYWYPLYAYCRRQGHTPSDGEDLTQQFFAVFLAKNSFAVATPGRGRFRNFLLASFKNFLANDHQRSQTVKRGGGLAFVSWDELEPELSYQKEPSSGFTPEKLYDQAWAFRLLDRAMSSLRSDYTASGKSGVFEALQIFLTGEETEITYKEIGAKLQMSESAIKMAVSRLRQRYGQLLRQEIAHTVADEAGVEDELRHLIGAMMSR